MEGINHQQLAVSVFHRCKSITPWGICPTAFPLVKPSRVGLQLRCDCYLLPSDAECIAKASADLARQDTCGVSHDDHIAAFGGADGLGGVGQIFGFTGGVLGLAFGLLAGFFAGLAP